MIYYTSDVIRHWSVDMLRLDVGFEEDKFIYVSRNTYDQALILDYEFLSNSDRLYTKMGFGESKHLEAIEILEEVLPKPLNILPCFLAMISDNVELDTKDITSLIGVISYMSMSIDFLQVTKVPEEMRLEFKFTKSQILNWKSHYQEFINDLEINSKQEVIIQQVTQPIYQSVPQVTQPIYQTEQYKVNRSDKEDFLDKEENVEIIDIDAFKAEIGWSEIPSPNENIKKESVNKIKEKTLEDCMEENIKSIVSNFA